MLIFYNDKEQCYIFTPWFYLLLLPITYYYYYLWGKRLSLEGMWDIENKFPITIIISYDKKNYGISELQQHKYRSRKIHSSAQKL